MVFPPMPLADWADTKETLHRLASMIRASRLSSWPGRLIDVCRCGRWVGHGGGPSVAAAGVVSWVLRS
jgi:hypothetical protein